MNYLCLEVCILEKAFIETDNEALARAGVDFHLAKSQGSQVCTISSHTHEAIEILYIIKGSLNLYADGFPHYAETGSLILIRPNTIHNIYTAEEGEHAYYVLRIKPSLMSSFADAQNSALYLMQLGLHSESIKFIWSKEEVTPFLPILESMIHDLHEQSFATDLSLKANAILLLTTILRQTLSAHPLPADIADINPTATQKIYNAIAYINNNYELDISAKTCALAIGMSYTYFSRLFKHFTKQSFTSYLTEVRIRQAEKLLMLTENSITDIALMCGFNDVSYFISKFKSICGKTPYLYRKNSI